MARAAVACLAPLAAAALALPDGYALVPGGYAHRSCIHAAPAAGAVAEACAHPFLRAGAGEGHGAAWKAWAQVSGPSGGAGNLTALNSSWAVPGAPQVDAGQTLFWWNGAEPLDTSAVLQPVLQWGASAAGGGSFWAISSWYVSAAHGSHYSPLVRVAAGDVVLGSVARLADGQTWAVAARAAQGGAPSALTFKPAPGAWPTAFHVLEAYGVSDTCDLYPACGAVNFTVTALAFDGVAAPPPIDWAFETQAAGCGERASASAGGTRVEIAFDTSR